MFDFRGVLNHTVGLLALKESKESIRQTQIVSRLSQLAFVFIPLTFVTSCFGMNLTVLGSGKGKMWLVCVIAVALTVLVLLISLFS
jgi:Mg2+ and Co2+ transporter CorA